MGKMNKQTMVKGRYIQMGKRKKKGKGIEEN